MLDFREMVLSGLDPDERTERMAYIGVGYNVWWVVWSALALTVFIPQTPWMLIPLLTLFALGEGSALALKFSYGTYSAKWWAASDRGKLKHRLSWSLGFVLYTVCALLWGVSYSFTDYNLRSEFAVAGFTLLILAFAWWLAKHLRARRFEG